MLKDGDGDGGLADGVGWLVLDGAEWWLVGQGHALDPTLTNDSGVEKIAPGVANTPQ